MFEGNSGKKNYLLKKRGKALLKLTSVALVFTLAISLNSNPAEAKKAKIKTVQKKQQKSTIKKAQTKQPADKKTTAKTVVKPVDVSKVKTEPVIARMKKYTTLVVMVNPEKAVTEGISPKVISKSGILVFGGNKPQKNSIAKFVVNAGITASADTSLDYVKSNKEKPLIVRAINTISQDGSDYLVISDDDALKILIENQASNFTESSKISLLQDLKQEVDSPYAKFSPTESPYANAQPDANNSRVINPGAIVSVEKTETIVVDNNTVKPVSTTEIKTTEIITASSPTGEVKPVSTTETKTTEMISASPPASEVKPAENNTSTIITTETKTTETGFNTAAISTDVKPTSETLTNTTVTEIKAPNGTTTTTINETKTTEIASLPVNPAAENKVLPEMNTRPLNTFEPTVPEIKSIIVANPEKVTSVIIDCSGLGLVRGMSPVVLTATEFDFYPGIIVDGIDEHSLAHIMNSGLVTYASSIDDAKGNKIAGSNPMIIRATDIQGILKSDPVIDPVDAAKLIMVNGKSNILGDRKVILVY